MDSGGLHDYTSFKGKLKLFLNRVTQWAWLLVPLAFVGTLLVGFIVAAKNGETEGLPAPGTVPTPQPVLFLAPSSEDAAHWPNGNGTFPGDASNLHNGTFLFRPLENPQTLRLYTGLYLGLQEIQKLYLRKLEVRNIIIDAKRLSQILVEAPNLETIILEDVAISGNFSRVVLPKLKEFKFSQLRNSLTDNYKTFESLKSILFFDLKPGKSWDVKKDVLDLGVDIKVSIGGTTIIEVDREKGLINLNVHVCEDIYQNIKPGSKPVTFMSLSWCPIKSPQFLPLKTLKYLNLNNAVPDKPILSEIIRGATQLESFHAFLPFTCDNASYISPEIPEIMIFTNLSDFSATIRTVSISKLAIYELPENYVSPITSLTLETVNVTGIIGNFHKNFANLNKVAVFNSSSEDDGYRILEEILKTPATWILMQDFSRNATYTTVEAFLTKTGISTNEMNFLIEKNATSGVYTGNSISMFDRQFNRFNLLQFNNIDTYGEYGIWDAVY